MTVILTPLPRQQNLECSKHFVSMRHDEGGNLDK